jgi:PPM family protein phosphatase
MSGNGDKRSDATMSEDESTSAPRWFTTSLPGPRDSPPPSVGAHVEFGAQSQCSPLRTVNGDHYLILRMGRYQETLISSLPERHTPRRFDEFAYGMVLADGMGRSGEMASRLAISTLVHLVVNFGKWNLRIDDLIAEEVMDRAARFYRGVDSTLVQAGHYSSLELPTTLTAVFFTGSELFFAHVGHSRAYLFRDDALMQLTHDHTLDSQRTGKALAIDMGASVRDLHHIMTETLGGPGSSAPKVDVERCGLLDGDVILLCTNGLTDVADDARISNALRAHHTPESQCHALVDLATNSGGNDDVTALVAHYRIPA